MEKIKQLYDSIQNLKELGHFIDVAETKRIEEELINEELIPALSKMIEPIISQVQRELVLLIQYNPDKPLQVVLTQQEYQVPHEESEPVFESNHFEQGDDLEFKNIIKSKRSNLNVKFPNGKVISNKNTSKTLCEVIDIIGPEKVAKLGIKNRFELVSKHKFEGRYGKQHKIAGDWLVFTHSSNKEKKAQIEKISEQLDLGLQVIKE